MSERVTLAPITTTRDTPQSAAAINDNFVKIAEALDKTVSRVQEAPDYMEGDLDMNSNRIFNLPEAVTNNEPLRLMDVALIIDGTAAAVAETEANRIATEENLVATGEDRDAAAISAAVAIAQAERAEAEADDAENSANIAVAAVSGSVNTFFATDKVEANALAAGLGDGATVITDEDEDATPSGVQTRRSVLSGALTAISSFLKTSMIAWKHGGTGAVWRTLYARLMDLPVSVKDFGAVGDGVTDDEPAIKAAIAYVSSLGGGTVFFPQPQLAYYVEKPIELASFVNLEGATQNTYIKKTNTVVSSGGVDCVVYGLDKARFFIKNLSAYGNRVRNVSTGVVTASSHGFYLNGCNYFDVKNTRALQCLVGYYYKTCWCCSLEQATAQQCQGYGFTLESANTSTVLRNTTAWGTGGGWSLSGCVYTQLIGCACDHSDAGGHPSDPFLPQGSGGNYQAPAAIFALQACQGITIISPGCENSYSKYMYAEGVQATIISPYVYNIENRSTAARYAFIDVRGTGESDISIINPRFTGIANPLGASPVRLGVFVETPAKQRVNFTGQMNQLSAFGDYALSATGVFSTYENKLLELTKEKMIVGQKTPFIHGATDIAEVILTGSTKEVQFDAVSANVVNFDMPLPTAGLFNIRATASYSSDYGAAQIKIIETDGITTNTLKSWTNSGVVITINQWLSVSATSGYSVFLRITTSHATDVLKFTNFTVTHVPNQN